MRHMLSFSRAHAHHPPPPSLSIIHFAFNECTELVFIHYLSNNSYIIAKRKRSRRKKPHTDKAKQQENGESEITKSGEARWQTRNRFNNVKNDLAFNPIRRKPNHILFESILSSRDIWLDIFTTSWKASFQVIKLIAFHRLFSTLNEEQM